MGAADGGVQAGQNHKLLIVDDDESHCLALKLALEKRGYLVRVATGSREALSLGKEWQPGCALVDLRMPGSSGLTLIPALRSVSAAIRIVVLSGYSSVATALEATRLGAVCYLTKPVELAALEAALRRGGEHEDAPPSAEAPPLEHLEWVQIQEALAEHEGNIPATARSLGLHRRALQRQLWAHSSENLIRRGRDVRG